MKKVAKSFLSAVLSVALVFTMMPISAFAANENKTISKVVEKQTDVLYKLPDSDDLFKGYVNKTMYEDVSDGISPFGIAAGSRLEDGTLTKDAYNTLKIGFEKIAKGQQASTKFTIPCKITLTREEVGSDLIVNGALSEVAMAKMDEKINASIDFNRLIDALLADCPYDLYWFDKTAGWSRQYSMSTNGVVVMVDNISFDFNVASAYRGGNEYTVDTAKTGAASKAVANAKKIVDKYAGKSDEEKLALYRDEICSLVSYNHDAADSSKVTPYGDPWQLIYVFDGDPNTNVVCEGYSKAFQYLCDISTFKENLVCFSVTGVMKTPDGAGGPHMWNIVQMKGKNRLVDVTNCDDNTIGYPDKLYMIMADTSGDNHKTHIVNGINYTYDKSENNLNCDGYLCICKDGQVHTHTYGSWKSDKNNHWKQCDCGHKSQVAPHSFTWVIDKVATEQSEGLKHEECAVCKVKRNINTVIARLPHTHNMEKIQQNKSTCTSNGNNQYYHCIKCDKYYKDEAGKIETTPTDEILPLKAHSPSKWIVSKYATTKANGYKYKKCIDCDKKLSSKSIAYIKSAYLSTSTYTYNGKVKTPSVKVKDAKGNILEKNIDYTVSYAKGRKYVGKYKVTVTFKGDYRGTKTLYFKINPKSTVISTLKSYKKSFKAYWKKQTTQTTGYQLRYSASSKMKNYKTLTIKGYKNTSKTVKNLKAKSKYYVQVRVYKKTSSGTYYSSWSKVKSVRTR